MTLQRRLHLVGCNTEDTWLETALKVAFATSDMTHVDQHFGAAQSFVIYAVDQGRSCFLEAVEFGAQEEPSAVPDIEATGMRSEVQGQAATEGDCLVPEEMSNSGGTESEAQVSHRRSHPRAAGPLLNASGHNNEGKLADKIAVLEGCIAVYSQAVGASAINQLKARGVQPIKVSSGTLISGLLVALQEELRQGPSSWLARAIESATPADPSRFDQMEEEGWQE